MKKLRLAMIECFELAFKYGISSHLLWDRKNQKWIVSIIIIPKVYEWYDVVKSFEVK
jgi:hypothetical protein